MAENEYEELPEWTNPAVHMAAGAAAGMLEHTVMFPFDVLKVRRKGRGLFLSSLGLHA